MLPDLQNGPGTLLCVLVYVQYGYWIYSIAQVVPHVCDIQMIEVLDGDQYSEARRMIRPLESAGPAERRSAPNDFF